MTPKDEKANHGSQNTTQENYDWIAQNLLKTRDELLSATDVYTVPAPQMAPILLLVLKFSDK